jgi:hypothetical protein
MFEIFTIVMIVLFATAIAIVGPLANDAGRDAVWP